MLNTILKRDGREVIFEHEKITNAILKAFQASNSAKTRRTAEEPAVSFGDEEIIELWEVA